MARAIASARTQAALELRRAEIALAHAEGRQRLALAEQNAAKQLADGKATAEGAS